MQKTISVLNGANLRRLSRTTISLVMIILLVTISNYSFSMNNTFPPGAKDPVPLNTLVINANVTVVLVSGSESSLRIEGDKDFEQQLVIKQTGNKLRIDSKKNQNLKTKGIIYVPARHLGYIEINGDAHLNSQTALHNPRLDVLINGECKLYILTTGELNLLESASYIFVNKTREVLLPVADPVNKK